MRVLGGKVAPAARSDTFLCLHSRCATRIIFARRRPDCSLSTMLLLLFTTASAAAPPSLIPAASVRVEAPLYWCSWQAQGRAWMSHGPVGPSATPASVRKFWDDRTHQQWMDGSTSAHFFANGTSGAGATGWGYLFPAVRRDLYLMLDNGWQNGTEATSRDLILDTAKYPEFAAANPTTSLTLLNEHVKSLGWRGLGLWVNGDGAMSDDALRRLHDAQIGLLKYDGGDSQCQVTQRAKKLAPGLIVEHGACVHSCPMNGWPGDGRSTEKDALTQASIMNCSDAFRT